MSANPLGTPPPSVLHPIVPGQRQMPTFTWDQFKVRRNQKLSFLFFGDKGVGKSVEAFSLKGRHLLFSLDNQSTGVADGFYHSDPRIWVVDPMQFYRDAQPEDAPWSAFVTVEYIRKAMEEIVPRFHPHWIGFDGLETLNAIADQKMRYQHNLRYSQGFAERAYWKDRNAVLNALWRQSQILAAMGTWSTAYYQGNFGDEGSIHMPEKTPKWIGMFKEATEIVVECRSSYNNILKRRTYSAYVLTSKPHRQDVLQTGLVIDIPEGKTIPFGPGMEIHYERAEAALKGVPIMAPEYSSIPSEVPTELPPYVPPPQEGEVAPAAFYPVAQGLPPPPAYNSSPPPAPARAPQPLPPAGATEL